MICRQKRTHPNPGPAPALQLAPQPQQQPVPRRRRKPPNPLVMPWILQRQEKGCYSIPLAELLQTDIPGYKILSGCHLPFYLIEECTTSRSLSPISDFVRMPPAFLPHRRMHHIKKSVTNFRKPLEKRLNFVRMPPAFLTSSKNAYTTASRSQSPISGSR